MVRYFISDLHLSDKRLDLIQAFVHLTNELVNQHQPDSPCELYILGDFFEAYIGDDYQPEWIQQLDQQLVTLHKNGIPVYFIAGNRDFLVGKDWFERCEVTELPEQSALSEQSKIVLTHGDEFCTDDIAYQEFRAMVRQPAWQQQVLAMPLEQRLALAQKLRDDSKSMSQDKSQEIMDVNLTAIERSIPSSTQLLIHGHTHRPALHAAESIPRLVLGDWDRKVWIAQLAEQHIIQYSIEVDVYNQSPSSHPLSKWSVEHTLQLF